MSLGVQGASAWNHESSLQEIDKDIINYNSHDIYFDLTSARNRLVNIAEKISLLDENKNSLLWQLHQFIVAGNIRVPQDIVLEALEYAEKIVTKKSEQLSSDTFNHINDALD